MFMKLSERLVVYLAVSIFLKTCSTYLMSFVEVLRTCLNFIQFV